MRVFGVEIRKAAPDSLASVPDQGRGWFSLLRESFGGAWQRDVPLKAESILSHHAVWSCITLIASDIAKLRPRVVELNSDGIWSEVRNTPVAKVLQRPNHFQNHIQFKEWWVISKLIRGNAYALLERAPKGAITAMYLLDPDRVQVLVGGDGGVYYRLQTDNLAGLDGEGVTVPASEILHDRMNCLFHPLVGLSPIFACGAAAGVGLRIQKNSDSFFGNNSNPGGILSTPGSVSEDVAKRLKERWEAAFGGGNSGKIAVLGNDMKFQPMRMTAVDSQMIEHLKWSAETVCGTFHVPPFKIGLGQLPTYQNGELLNQIYYSDCLQSHIESFEAVMDAGFGFEQASGTPQFGIELDLRALLRMDTATHVKTLAEAVKGAIMAPNEARKEVDLPPLPGGDMVYLQQQNYSLEALSRRDQSADPFAKGANSPPPVPETPPTPPDDASRHFELSAEDHQAIALLMRGLLV